MMNSVELDAYFTRIGLPDDGRRLVEKARRTSPVRKVQSRLGNVLTRFPSRKMQRVIVAESRTVEFPAFIRYEHDPDVLEYYPQPVALDLRVVHPLTGKVSRIQHTPDVLLLTRDGVRIDEWREEARLQKLAAKHPERFTKAGKQWNCPQVEAHLHAFGIQYGLRTADEHPHTLVQNLLFLADYYAPEASSVDDKALARIRECLEEHGAITLADAIEFGKVADSPDGVPDGGDAPVRAIATDTGFTADDIYRAIADELVTYDLSAEPLSDSFRSRVYRDQSTLEFSRRLDTEADDDDQQQHGADRIGSIQAGDTISYDGKDYNVTLVGAENITLTHESGSTEVAVSTVEDLYRREQIRITHVEGASDDPTHMKVGAFSPEELARAVERGQALDLADKDPALVRVSRRTLRRYRQRVREAGANPVQRNLALVGSVRNRGNRNRKLPEEVLALIERVADEHYNQPNSPSLTSVFTTFTSACQEKGLRPCSAKSFNLAIKRHVSTRHREGKRRAYQVAPIVWYLKAKDPIHGVRPFEYVHIDHTPLDIVLISGETKKLLGRPWLSLAIDAESRAIVGFYLSFEPPSYRACMMVLRDIVRRHGRLPNTIITDNGPEFRTGLRLNRLVNRTDGCWEIRIDRNDPKEDS